MLPEPSRNHDLETGSRWVGSFPARFTPPSSGIDGVMIHSYHAKIKLL